jgi:hypothetical protein
LDSGCRRFARPKNSQPPLCRPQFHRCHRPGRSSRHLFQPPRMDIKSAHRSEGLPLSTIFAPTPQHCSSSAPAPLCTGKPSLTCSQVECLSCHQLEPQPQAILTPARSCRGHLTPPPSSLQATTGAIFHQSSSSPDHPSTNITESQSPSMTTTSPTSDVSPAAHRRPPPPEPPSWTALYQ